ncbi:MAG: hypothetical protein AB7H93_14245 [Vicinamibacterales bacterium]
MEPTNRDVIVVRSHDRTRTCFMARRCAAIAPRQRSADMVGALRGVGGLAKGPAVRGVSVRQLTLENPGRQSQGPGPNGTPLARF